MKKNFPVTILRYIIRILIFELGLAILVGVILFLKERTLNSFADWMFWAGAIILITGVSSLIGGWETTRSSTYQIGMTVGERDIPTQTKSDLMEEESNFSFLQLCTGVGILAIVISRLV